MKRAAILSLVLLILPVLSSAGDFLALDRAPKPDSLNADGIPIYESYWNHGEELPNECTEAIGEEGAQLYAERMGWKKLFTAPDKGDDRYGFDQVWEDEKTGKIIVVEAKGRKYKGQSGRQFRQSKARGHYQASIEWCIEVCKNEMRSQTATKKSREIADLVLRKISEGNLETRIIVTNHVYGIPFDTWTDRAVLEVPDEYRGKTFDELLSLDLEESESLPKYGDDFNTVQYGTEWEREILRQRAQPSVSSSTSASKSSRPPTSPPPTPPKTKKNKNNRNHHVQYPNQIKTDA